MEGRKNIKKERRTERKKEFRWKGKKRERERKKKKSPLLSLNWSGQFC